MLNHFLDKRAPVPHIPPLGFVLLCLFSGFCFGQDISGRVREVKLYEGQDVQLLDVSKDGRLLLARKHLERKCDPPNPKKYCSEAKLLVFDTASGRRVSETTFSTADRSYVTAAGFVENNNVELVLIVDSASKSEILRWNPERGTRSILGSPPKDAKPYCALGAGKFISWRLTSTQPRSDQLVISSIDSEDIIPMQPPAFSMDFRDIFRDIDCAAWRARNEILVSGAAGPGQARTIMLYWISLLEAVPFRICHIPKAIMHGHAVSPDGRTIAIVSSKGEDRDGLMGPNHKVFLNLLEAQNCNEKATFELPFPEKPKEKSPLLAPKDKYLAGARFNGRWAVSISPDNKKVAVGYGVLKDGIYSDGEAYYGIYSMVNGQRLVTLKGDTNKNGLWVSLRQMDSVSTVGAPLEGAMLFSYDSKLFYTGAKKLRQWDLSGLPVENLTPSKSSQTP